MGELKIAYSDKKVTPWGAMKLLKDFIDHSQILHYLNELNIPQPQSNRGYEPTILILGFWLSIFTGGNRFFYKFDIEKNSEVSPQLQQWFMDQFKVGKTTVDLDSTVITRYSNLAKCKLY